MKKGNYYNTTHLKGSELENAKKTVLNQDTKVLLFFRNNPDAKLTKYEVHDLLSNSGIIYQRTPENSIGRALNTLLGKGLINKLQEYKIERYGKRNHVWQLAE